MTTRREFERTARNELLPHAHALVRAVRASDDDAAAAEIVLTAFRDAHVIRNRVRSRMSGTFRNTHWRDSGDGGPFCGARRVSSAKIVRRKHLVSCSRCRKRLGLGIGGYDVDAIMRLRR